MPFHEGEQAVQAQAGVRSMADRIGRGIRDAIPPLAQEFLQEQTTAVAASIDADGRVWASALIGAPGFLTALDEHTLWINAQPAEGDPLLENLKVNPNTGLVVIEFALRRRVRLNGTATIRPDGLHITVREVYPNCPKYIQARLFREVKAKATTARHMNALTEVQQQAIRRADTFFIASYHPISGADASHRGGNPGFVQVIDANTLEFPDYSGNMMFNTLGNLHANPRCGLLFMDFENGTVLQLSGQAEVIWNPDAVAMFPETERVVRFRVEQVIEIANALPLKSEYVEYSPYNAPVAK